MSCPKFRCWTVQYTLQNDRPSMQLLRYHFVSAVSLKVKRCHGISFYIISFSKCVQRAMWYIRRKSLTILMCLYRVSAFATKRNLRRRKTSGYIKFKYVVYAWNLFWRSASERRTAAEESANDGGWPFDVGGIRISEHLILAGRCHHPRHSRSPIPCTTD